MSPPLLERCSKCARPVAPSGMAAHLLRCRATAPATPGPMTRPPARKPKARRKPSVTCQRCKKVREHRGRGLCGACYTGVARRGEREGFASTRVVVSLKGRKCEGFLCDNKPRRCLKGHIVCGGHAWRLERGTADWSGPLRPQRRSVGKDNRRRRVVLYIGRPELAVLDKAGEARGLSGRQVLAVFAESLVRALRHEAPGHQRQELLEAFAWVRRAVSEEAVARADADATRLALGVHRRLQRQEGLQ